jgi:uncharacterized membrane protein YhaH (DUF805 family)
VTDLGARARFLFREESGVIDAPTWRRHVVWLAALLALLTAVWWVLSPYAHHDLATSAFLAPMTILAFGYLMIYAFAVLIIAVSYTMLSAKRLRDRRAPTGLAGLVPLLALCAGSLHFLQSKTPEAISYGYVVALDLALAAAALATIADLGFRPGRS